VDLASSEVPQTGSGAPEDYCRAIEAYLCRKNDGHLIRIVGPSFDLVCGWAVRGVPLRVAQRGIDRTFERYYAKGPRRRPVRIDFCDADVLDAFDEWRRAVGVTQSPGPDGEDPAAGPERHEPLAAHLDRAIARLTALRGGADRSIDQVAEQIIRELDAARAGAKGLRGRARAALLERLAELDEQLIATAQAVLDAETSAALRQEAEAELAPFRARMPQPAFERAIAVSIDRLLRERRGLPVLVLE
jgi:hypothetical protein